MISKEILANMIDHTCLKPDASNEDLKKLCDEAAKYNFKMVAINSVNVKLCKYYLKDSEVHVGAAIGFPLGQQTIETKVFETQDAIENGADEIDYVINITAVKEKNYDYIADEMVRIVEVCKKNNVISKVIFENCYLNKEEIEHLSKIAKEIKPDFIKTSTGFGKGGAVLCDVETMADNCGTVAIKAAGGIRDLKSMLDFIELGVKRIGTSSGIKILEEYCAKYE